MRRILFACIAAVAGTCGILVLGALPPRGQLPNPELMGKIVHLGLFPDKPHNMSFLEYFQEFMDVDQNLTKILERMEFNVLDMETLNHVIQLAEDAKRLKDMKMEAVRAAGDKLKPQSGRRDADVYHMSKFPNAWTYMTRRKVLQFMQHAVYSSRYEINKARNLRKRYENETVFEMGVVYGQQIELQATAALVFSTMRRTPLSVSMLWFVFHYTKLLNIAQDVSSNTEYIYLLNERLKGGNHHRDWFIGKPGLFYTSMPTNAHEATMLDPDIFFRRKMKTQKSTLRQRPGNMGLPAK